MYSICTSAVGLEDVITPGTVYRVISVSLTTAPDLIQIVDDTEGTNSYPRELFGDILFERPKVVKGKKTEVEVIA